MAKASGHGATAQRRAESTESRDRAIAEEISRENAPDSPVVEHLQRQGANAFILYTNYKHYHWQTFGPLFRDLHLLFDEFAQATLETVDQFAERLRMIGQDPVSSPQEFIERGSVRIAARNNSMRGMIEEARSNLLVVISEMRAGARAADEANDPGTVDLFSRLVQIHEKHEWWLRDMLEKGDKLTV